MNCIIGMDGGGTKTLLRAVTLEGDIICEATGGSTNLCSNTPEQVRDNLVNLWKKVLDSRELNPLSICLGTAGISAVNAAKTLEQILFEITYSPNITVVGDMAIPLRAYSPDQDAMVLIAGTGSICYAQNKAGEFARGGGFGHILGDEGSGYWIALEGLKAICLAEDNQIPMTLLKDIIYHANDWNSFSDLITHVYAKPIQKSEIARLSIHVLSAATQEDSIAIDILERAGLELAQLCESTAKKVKISHLPYTLYLSGGILTHYPFVIHSLKEYLYNRYPQLRIQTIDKDAAWGAIEIAKAMV